MESESESGGSVLMGVETGEGGDGAKEAEVEGEDFDFMRRERRATSDEKCVSR